MLLMNDEVTFEAISDRTLTESLDEQPMCQDSPSGKKVVEWSAAEDGLLLRYVDNFGPNSWNRISKLMSVGKSEIKCHMRWL